MTSLGTLFHNAFQPLDAIYRFGDDLSEAFSAVRKIEIGKSAEGRPIVGFTTHIDQGDRHEKPEIVIVAGQHAREVSGLSVVGVCIGRRFAALRAIWCSWRRIFMMASFQRARCLGLPCRPQLRPLHALTTSGSARRRPCTCCTLSSSTRLTIH